MNSRRRRPPGESTAAGKGLAPIFPKLKLPPMNRPAHILIRLFWHSSLALLLLAICGCSSFHRDWQRAGRIATPENVIAGRWEGRWVSDFNGHNGTLRCLLTPQDGDRYAARFRASYLWLLRFEYTVPLQVTATTNGWTFHGMEDLGKMAGGVYRYDGTIIGTNFHSTYRAEVDHGFFEMNRVPALNIRP